VSLPPFPPARVRWVARRLLAALAVVGGWAALVLAGSEVFARPAPPPRDDAPPPVPADDLAARFPADPDEVRAYREHHVRVRVRVDRVVHAPNRHVRVEHHARGRVVTCRLPWSYRDQVREGGEVTVEAAVLTADERQVDMGHAILE
jgi:hypothetical protein